MNKELYFNREVNIQGKPTIVSLKEASLKASPDGGSFASLPQVRQNKEK